MMLRSDRKIWYFHVPEDLFSEKLLFDFNVCAAQRMDSCSVFAPIQQENSDEAVFIVIQLRAPVAPLAPLQVSELAKSFLKFSTAWA